MTQQYTVAEASKQLGVSRQRIHQLIQKLELETSWVGPIRVLSKKQFRQLSSRVAPRPKKSGGRA